MSLPSNQATRFFEKHPHPRVENPSDEVPRMDEDVLRIVVHYYDREGREQLVFSSKVGYNRRLARIRTLGGKHAGTYFVPVELAHHLEFHAGPTSSPLGDLFGLGGESDTMPERIPVAELIVASKEAEVDGSIVPWFVVREGTYDMIRWAKPDEGKGRELAMFYASQEAIAEWETALASVIKVQKATFRRIYRSIGTNDLTSAFDLSRHLGDYRGLQEELTARSYQDLRGRRGVNSGGLDLDLNIPIIVFLSGEHEADKQPTGEELATEPPAEQ